MNENVIFIRIIWTTKIPLFSSKVNLDEEFLKYAVKTMFNQFWWDIFPNIQ